MKILVTGGAGYIGSIMTQQLLEKNFKVVMIDNLAGGYKQAVDKRADFELVDLSNQENIEKIFKKYKFDTVIHFAGVISMGESMENPAKYFKTNVFNAINLFEVMVKYKVLKLIFSSTAGVYGNPIHIPIKEDDPKSPTNPYGESKLMVEQLLKWYDRIYGIRSISLRYFNAAGATLDGQFGEDHKDETHIIPLAIKAAIKKAEFIIFGNDYQTKDGTCVRDYVHVIDLCKSHVLALEALMNNHKTDFFNVGPGIGFSNIEVVEMVKKISAFDFPVKFGKRRPGDADELIADPTKIKKEFGWQPKYSDLKTIVETAWKWHKSHPRGYT